MKKLHVARLASLILLTGVASSVTPALAQQRPNPPGLFAKHCAVCHGPQGTPNPAFAKKKVRDLQDPAWQDGITNEKIAEVIREGVPKTITITDEEIRLALAETVNVIVDAVRVALERTPPELSADIVDRGIVLTGGGSMLRNLDKRLREETGLPVTNAEDPLSSVVLGAGKMLSDFNLLRKISID